MIYIGIGSNLPSDAFGPPLETCEAALVRLAESGMEVVARSPWYESAPVPVSDQPWFVNGVAAVATSLGPAELLECLHDLEAEFGRVRRLLNEARILDLDLVAYDEMVVNDETGGDSGPVVPHPRLHERAFVLLPLQDLAPQWRHPVSKRPIGEMVAELPQGQVIRPVPGTS